MKHEGGISSFRILSLDTANMEFRDVWELAGYSHDSNEYWETGQAIIYGNEVSCVIYL